MTWLNERDSCHEPFHKYDPWHVDVKLATRSYMTSVEKVWYGQTESWVSVALIFDHWGYIVGVTHDASTCFSSCTVSLRCFWSHIILWIWTTFEVNIIGLRSCWWTSTKPVLWNLWIVQLPKISWHCGNSWEASSWLDCRFDKGFLGLLRNGYMFEH